MWLKGIAGKWAQGRIAINRSLGRDISNGYFADHSDEAINGRIQSHIEAILASPREEIKPYKDQFLRIYKNLEEFKNLPLWVSHYALNEVNVLIDEDCNITGLIDRDLSTPIGFWVCFGRIHTYAGEYNEGNFVYQIYFKTQNGPSGTPCSMECQRMSLRSSKARSILSRMLLSLALFWIAFHLRRVRYWWAKFPRKRFLSLLDTDFHSFEDKSLRTEIIQTFTRYLVEI